jgi:hypothetical protein
MQWLFALGEDKYVGHCCNHLKICVLVINNLAFMKNLLLLLLIVVTFSACIKDENITDPIVDPIPPKVLSRDTITAGQLWGFAIGQSSASIYVKVQEVKVERKVAYLSIVGNVFTSLESLENKIPLYTSIYLDQTLGTSTGIQIYFANNTVKSIWTNDGVKLNRWPSNTEGASTVAVGDQVGDIYSKLVNIKKQSVYANKFERISMFEKDIAKPYDGQMTLSRLWYVNGDVDDKSYYHLELNFAAGKLVSIYSTLFEKP